MSGIASGISSAGIAASLDPTVIAAAAEVNLAADQAALASTVADLASGDVGGNLDIVG